MPLSHPPLARRVRAIAARSMLVLLPLVLVACTSAPRVKSSTALTVLGQATDATAAIGQPAPPGTGELGAVSCADAMHCWAVGVAPQGVTNPATIVAATVDGGRTWHAQPVTAAVTPDLTGISCALVTRCMAVGSTGSNPPIGTVLTTRNGGATWSVVSAPAGALAVTAVTCATAGSCTAVVSDGTIFWSALTTNFGQAWQREGDLPPGVQDARDVSCTGAGVCLVAGNTPTTTGHAQGAVAVSTDGGAMWAAADVPAGTGLLQSATCASATRCIAVGTTSTTTSDVVPANGLVLLSDDGGRTWAPSPGAPPVEDIFGIACPQVKVCVMVGTQWIGATAVGTGAVAVSENGGESFRRSSTSYTPLSLTALACASATGCVSAGGDTVARVALPVEVSPIPRPSRVR